MFILALTLLFTGLMLNAQDKVSGFVIEETADGSFKPIQFANVFWNGTQRGTTTDTSGYFELDVIPANHETSEDDEHWDLIFSYVGYTSDTVHVHDPEKLTIILKPYKELDEVQVVYRKKGTEISYMNPIKVETLGEAELYKAACCNLSESFETNPSVDVSFTDAVTGTRQIQMLGLDGKYSQITRESMPAVRGLYTNQGLTYIPGTWIESIQLNKGAGSVVNGYESVTGQINVELKKADHMDPWFINAYANQGGRTELNVDLAKKLSDKVSSGLLLHGNLRPFEIDGNSDGFMDFPTGHQVNAVHRWRFTNLTGWEGQLNAQVLIEDREGGQVAGDLGAPKYGLGWQTGHYELWGKTGYSFKEKKYKSIGFQASGMFHDQVAYFGNTTYDSRQQSGYFNSIFQSIIGTTTHKYRTGLSVQYDDFDETLDTANFSRTEVVPGAYFEYTFSYFEDFALVAGMRGDYHNYYGFFATPRLHLRYEMKEGMVLRASGGRGQRTANVIAENLSYLASSRQWDIWGTNQIQGFGLRPEVAWNFGANWTYDFRLDYKPSVLSVDFYHTEFENQIVLDLEDPRQARVYNLFGRSYSTSAQVQWDYELFRKMDIRLAYRWYDVMTQYVDGFKKKPFLSNHRAFVNWSYSPRGGWNFDVTAQWQGAKRVPSTANNLEANRRATQSPDLVMMNTQVTKNFTEVLDIYVGMENITNVRQNDPIIAVNDPYGSNFDASMIWGPIFGRMMYIGIRLKPVKQKSSELEEE